MNVKEIINQINIQKKDIKKYLYKGKYSSSLKLIATCASILYKTNICCYDEELEEDIKKVSDLLGLNNDFNYSAREDTILFWDGFGLNSRGLAQIYIKALVKNYKVVYVTWNQRREKIPDILSLINSSDSLSVFVEKDGKNPLNMINELNKLVQTYCPSKFFLYSTPDDVVATTIMYAYEGVMKRFQINLTDHAFWLGQGCIDECIEFRDYGASLSLYERKIPKEKIIKLPFYPVIDYGSKFQGFPFEVKENQKIIFSGGALYKTFGEDNKYYKIIEQILINHENAIFWYAGSGDSSELKKLINKYGSRVQFTPERSDLFQVLQNVDVYLSTYPICGGLMFQYAAKAGVVPVTLRFDQDVEGYLLNQNNINVVFKDVQGLLYEIDRLLEDDDYSRCRSELMKKSVVSEEEFERKLIEIVDGLVVRDDILYNKIDMIKFRQTYIERLSGVSIGELMINRDNFKDMVELYPYKVSVGGGIIVMKKIQRIINRMR